MNQLTVLRSFQVPSIQRTANETCAQVANKASLPLSSTSDCAQRISNRKIEWRFCNVVGRRNDKMENLHVIVERSARNSVLLFDLGVRHWEHTYRTVGTSHLMLKRFILEALQLCRHQLLREDLLPRFELRKCGGTLLLY